VQGAAQKKRQRVTLALAEGFGVIRADERRLKQILLNLLSNAVKFTPDGGTVGLEVAADPGGGTMRFTVWDTGIGIAPRDQTRLFLPFVQLDSSLARHHAGTGLGLALVRKLVELHGGTVGIESEPGKGSRFSLVLPLQPATADHPPALTPAFGIPRVSRTSTVAPRPPGGPSARILLAEDDETNIVTVADFLGSRGHDVRVARNGAEALRLAEEAVPDLVIMDVQMPVLDGLTAMARLRAAASPALRAVPIIALTALAMSGDRERCLEAGADEYLTKPVGLKQLAAAVAEHLSRGRVRRAAAGEG
jgi:CheY-like chemotaxis protein/anti-sigma regulatory factor (Ser/Thr protein kinase)